MVGSGFRGDTIFESAVNAHNTRTNLLRIFLYGVLLAVMFLLSGCLSQQRLLQPNQSLLTGQRTKGNQKVTGDELAAFYKQKANRRFAGTPFKFYLTLYYIGSRTHSQAKVERQISEATDKYNRKIVAANDDTLKVARIERKREKALNRLNRRLTEGNWLMRVGEPPVAFDTALARQSAESMRQYLQSKGFFRANVNYEYKKDSLFKTVRVTYLITENQRYRIMRADWQTGNRLIDSLMVDTREKSLLRAGDGYDNDRINAEQDRIDKLLKNNGYYDFSRRYITFDVDTTVRDTTMRDTLAQGSRVSIQTIINDPPNGKPHRVFTVDGVFLSEDAGISGRARRDTLVFRNIRYLARSYRFSHKILDSKVLIRPQARYSLQTSLETQRLLGSLDMFKFANIFYDTTGGRFNAKIYTSPVEKYTYSVEGGGTVTLANGYPGPFGSADFKIRNVFGGLEILELRATGGVEGVAGFRSESDPAIYPSQQANVSASLIFPQVLFPTPLRYLFSRFSPQTRVQVGYNLTNRPEFLRFGFQGSLTYAWQPDPLRRFNITPIEVSRISSNYANSAAGNAFRKEINDLRANGSTLWRAFQKAFVSSVNASYVYNSNITGQVQRARYLRLFAESGGSFLNLPLPESWNIASDSTRDGLQFYRFVKFNVDYRYYLPRNARSSWAFRINAGVGNPYGPSGTLPYEKFFFAGGSNSVRAWLPRRLGLGSFRDSLDGNGNYTYRIEQPGDMVLEGSAEYRTNFIKFSSVNLQLAFFADAGNVWLIRKNPTVPNGEFRFDRFYREIALGAGMGLRIDFSFLLLRLDAGTKLHDPGRRPEDRWAAQNLLRGRSVFSRGQSSLNFGIGYPF